MGALFYVFPGGPVFMMPLKGRGGGSPVVVIVCGWSVKNGGSSSPTHALTHMHQPTEQACGVLEEAAKADDQGKLVNVMETVRLCCRIFFSLNWQVRTHT